MLNGKMTFLLNSGVLAVRARRTFHRSFLESTLIRHACDWMRCGSVQELGWRAPRAHGHGTIDRSIFSRVGCAGVDSSQKLHPAIPNPTGITACSTRRTKRFASHKLEPPCYSSVHTPRLDRSHDQRSNNAIDQSHPTQLLSKTFSSSTSLR